MRLIVWTLRALLFFTLFAFALNNSQDAAVRWFFGHEWHAPMVIIVLAAFAMGCAFGVLAMVPAWWRQRREAQRAQQVPPPSPPGTAPAQDNVKNTTQAMLDGL